MKMGLEKVTGFNVVNFLSRQRSNISLLKLSSILILAAMSYFCFTQSVYKVKYPSQADVKVYVVKYESQADLKVFRVKYRSQADKNDGKWYFTKYAVQAHKKIFFTKYPHQADIKIYFVKYPSRAGWKNISKRGLMD